MPTNKKEGIIFTTLMCFCMVLCMSLYNSLLHGPIILSNFIFGFILGFIIALFLDTFIVGITAKKIVSHLSFIDKTSKIQMILAISTLMILGMVTLMTLFGLLIDGDIPNSFITTYIHVWMMNFIMALPLQLILVGPFSRGILSLIHTKKVIED
ncbi:DUF2798 domain-containing protein [Companilactobacillus sp. DQM5]|uniref:DUF2798 domain-containing protein n=1 Tax=Companilactobacillus sp. DQM5 TaxID=3463359 RepID=UPI00405912B6